MPGEQMLAAVCPAPGLLEARWRPMPEVGPEDILVRVHTCGICGTDLHWVQDPGVVSRGISLGHEFAGEVVVSGGGVSWPRAGDRVAIEPFVPCRSCDTCRSGRYNLCPRQRTILGYHRDGGFAEYVVTPAFTARGLPASMDWELGSLAEPLAVCVHGARLAAVPRGGRVAVLGAGSIGLLTLVAARAAGAGEIIVTARYPHQAEAARALGADRVLGTDAESARALEAEARGRPIDCVFESVGGSGDTLRQSLRLARPGGTVCILGGHWGEVAIRPGLILGNELRVVGSAVYCADGDSTDFDRAIALLARQGDALRRLITHRLPLGDVARAMEIARDKSTRSIKVTVSPDL